MRTPHVFLFLLFGLNASLCAQDKIFRKNGQVVKSKVLEIGTDEVKYKLFADENGPIYALEKDKIEKIVYENGRTEKFTFDLKDPEQYEGQLRKAVKIDFLGPLLGYTQLTYEKSTGVGKGYELTLAIIGAGKNHRIDWFDGNYQSAKRNQFGLAAAVGYKFSKLPDFLFGRSRFTHLMQGAYAKPSFYIGNYGENRVVYKGTYDAVERQHTTFAALEIELGKQWVFGEKFLLDMYWGLGYGFDNKKEIDGSGSYDAFNYVNARLGTSPGFSTTFGMKIGWLIK